MRDFILILLINSVLVTCHNINKRQAYDEEFDAEGYDWAAGVPHYEHIHYSEEGEIDFTPRIIGGTPAAHGDFPAKISVQTIAGQHFCGGALIDLRHVLTAAHCLTNDFGVVANPQTIRLMGDDVSIQRWGSAYRQIRTVTHLFVHPDFNLRTYSADIAVIRTLTPFTATNRLTPFPRSIHTPPDDFACHLAGWGTTSETNTRPHPILLRVQLDIVSMSICNGTGSFNGAIPHSFVCAGSMDGSRDACFGDSGGGLICNGQISGIVSFGFGCGRPRFPGAYVDVSRFNHWIDDCLSSTVPHDEIPRPITSPNPNSVARLLKSAPLIASLAIAIHAFAY